MHYTNVRTKDIAAISYTHLQFYLPLDIVFNHATTIHIAVPTIHNWSSLPRGKEDQLYKMSEDVPNAFVPVKKFRGCLGDVTYIVHRTHVAD